MSPIEMLHRRMADAERARACAETGLTIAAFQLAAKTLDCPCAHVTVACEYLEAADAMDPDRGRELPC